MLSRSSDKSIFLAASKCHYVHLNISELLLEFLLNTNSNLTTFYETCLGGHSAGVQLYLYIRERTSIKYCAENISD